MHISGAQLTFEKESTPFQENIDCEIHSKLHAKSDTCDDFRANVVI
jgi:hypothetical protein